MAAVTSTQQLPYPAGGDRPCDSWMTWNSLAFTVEDRLTALDTVLDKTARAVPLAKAQCSVPRQLSANDYFVIFDTVDVDTDGMANLAGNPKFLVPQTAGYYHINAWAAWDGLDRFALPHIYISTGGNSFEVGMDMPEAADGYDSGGILNNVMRIATPGVTGIGIRVDSSGVTGDDPRVTRAALTVTWLRGL